MVAVVSTLPRRRALTIALLAITSALAIWASTSEQDAQVRRRDDRFALATRESICLLRERLSTPDNDAKIRQLARCLDEGSACPSGPVKLTHDRVSRQTNDDEYKALMAVARCAEDAMCDRATLEVVRQELRIATIRGNVMRSMHDPRVPHSLDQ